VLDQVKSTSDHIAHDLRTPLTRVRTQLDRARDLPHTNDAMRILVDQAIGGLDQALRIITALRRIAQIEARERRAGFAEIDLATILAEVDDRVRGLKAGGDDYLTKPFVFAELAARVEALLRRPLLSRETVLRVGPLEMDLVDRQVHRAERPIELLPREFKLLEYLMRRPGQVLTRAMLLEDVWNYRFMTETNLVDVHIGKLRRKIDATGETAMVHTVRGAGFMLCAPV